MTQTPQLTLNNGVVMPGLGLGVFQSSPDETVIAVRAALDTGYRHIDTAAGYGNEREVGRAIRESGLDRDEVFVETKVWISDYGFEETQHAFEKSAAKLGLDTIDLLILHQPMPKAFDVTLDAYRGLEALLAAGKVRAIGVSNFQPNDIQALFETTDVVPAVNQIELHPYFQEPAIQAANRQAGILTQAWSPIGGITFYPGWDDRGHSTLDDPVLGEIAAGHQKTPAQIMLAWHMAEGRSAIPKSVKPGRIAENFDVFDIALTSDEIAAIDGLDTGYRSGPDPLAVTLESNTLFIPEA